MLLALDTATRLISLALHDGQAVVAESTWQTDRYHTVELAPQTALLLRRAGLEPGQLKAVAVAIGPGSYTGLRIGLGFAKGLALAQGLALVGVPTLDGLMRAQPPRAARALALLEAGRGRVSAASYGWDERHYRWQPDGPVRVWEWPALMAALAEQAGPLLVVGEIDPASAEKLRALKGRVRLASPAQALRRAGYLAELGWERLRAGEGDDPARLAPIYGGQPAGSAPAAAPSGDVPGPRAATEPEAPSADATGASAP